MSEPNNPEKPFAETIGILQDLTNEYILLESIRQCSKELLTMVNSNNYWLKCNVTIEDFSKKIGELRQLVETD